MPPQAKKYNNIKTVQPTINSLPKLRTGTIGILNVTYILHIRFGENCTYMYTYDTHSCDKDIFCVRRGLVSNVSGYFIFAHFDHISLKICSWECDCFWGIILCRSTITCLGKYSSILSVSICTPFFARSVLGNWA